MKVYTAIGMMSGTSLDGVDIALIETDGLYHVHPVDSFYYPYDEATKEAVRAVFNKRQRDTDVAMAEARVTEKYLEALGKAGFKADLIGMHGQTITHDPAQKFTWQIGNATLISKITQTPVIADFRKADVAAGGQGAPFLPLYHAARAHSDQIDGPVAILNIGGVSNVTYIDEEEILAFDCGPGNALMDDVIKTREGLSHDEGGAMAAQGFANGSLVKQWLRLPYFQKKPPKSLDRNEFPLKEVERLNTKDALATLAAFTVESIAAARDHLPKEPKGWYVTGGGRHNKVLMQGLERSLGVIVKPVEALGWNGDALEAEGFAYLAVRSFLMMPLSLPSTTGVPKPLTGGQIFNP